MFTFLKRRNNLPRTAAVVVAAGSSRRMEGTDKLMAELDGIPVVLHSLLAFEECSAVDGIVLVCREECIPEMMRMTAEFGIGKLLSIVKGGQTRGQSVLAGVKACPLETQLVCIHDGARPLVTQEVILSAISAAAEYGCATAAVAAKDTIKLARDGFASQTPDRSLLYQIQTPQVFDREVYLSAREACTEELSDDCQLIERMGGRVFLSAGDYRNLKITTPEDLVVAQALLSCMEGE